MYSEQTQRHEQEREREKKKFSHYFCIMLRCFSLSLSSNNNNDDDDGVYIRAFEREGNKLIYNRKETNLFTLLLQKSKIKLSLRTPGV